MKPAILSVALLAAISSPAQALYCGASLVTLGQTQADILQKCGEPAHIGGRVDFRAGGGWSPWTGDHPLIGFNGLYFGASPLGPSVVEEWIYNFGPTKMMPRLVFENGVLTAIRYHGYGR